MVRRERNVPIENHRKKMAHTVREIADFVNGELKGDGAVEITGVAGIDDAQAGDITFVDNTRFKEEVGRTKASCVITSFDIDTAARAIIKCKNPSLALIKITQKIFPFRIEHPTGVDKSASLGRNARIGKNAAVGANSVIGDDVTIGEGSVIYPLVYIGRGARIGKNALIYPNVTIREKAVIGDNVTIHSAAVIGADGFGFAKDGPRFVKIPQMGIVEIQDEVEIGACAAIDRARFGKTVIGKGTKIDNLVQIAHNVKIGENCIIVAQVGISGSVNIGNNVMLGGQAGITDHVDIGDNVLVSAKGGITKSVPPRRIMSGIPARPHNVSKRLNVHFDNLPKIVEKINNLEKKVRELSGKEIPAADK